MEENAFTHEHVDIWEHQRGPWRGWWCCFFHVSRSSGSCIYIGVTWAYCTCSNWHCIYKIQPHWVPKNAHKEREELVGVLKLFISQKTVTLTEQPTFKKQSPTPVWNHPPLVLYHPPQDFHPAHSYGCLPPQAKVAQDAACKADLNDLRLICGIHYWGEDQEELSRVTYYWNGKWRHPFISKWCWILHLFYCLVVHFLLWL